MRKISPILVAFMFVLSAIAPAGVAAAKPTRDVEVRHVGTNYNNGERLPFEQGETNTAKPPLGPAKIGQVRTWLGLDDGDQTPAHPQSIYLKNYTLRGIGTHSEVWVANNLSFPNPGIIDPATGAPFTYNDCRNGDARTQITDTQVNYLISEFEGNMYPTESDWWGVPPNRDGHNALLPKLIPNLPSSEYKGEGDNIVILVDNVRDSNWYDRDNEHTDSYIAGFFFSVFNDYFNRNVMTVDAWDWIHRTGDVPDELHQPSPDPCTSAPARPFLYESVFAHEYQHLIHHYSDPNEVSWVNEGLSNFTEVITGYADLTKHTNEKGHDSATNAFLGWEAVVDASWNPIAYESGPENGLTAWEDQGFDELLADYGFTMFFMNYVHNQGYGLEFFNTWHHTAANGIDGMNAALAAVESTDTFASLWSDATVAALVDGYLDNGGTTGDASLDAALSNDATEATVLINADANATPGAPPWGSDYLDLGSGDALSTVSVAFEGANHYVGGPQWVLDDDGYFTNQDASSTLYGNNQDLSIARDVSGRDGEVLSFDHYYATELGWDFGFVQVSTDGGVTWDALECDGMTSDHDPGAITNITDNVPGYTGPSPTEGDPASNGTADDPLSVTCDPLPAEVDYLAFRLMTDPAVQFDGWHVKNIQLDGAPPTGWDTLATWDNRLFFTPVDLTFAFTLVGIDGTVSAWGDVAPGGGGAIRVFRPAELVDGNSYTLTPEEVAAFAGYDRVVAIVSGVPEEEFTFQYQPYSLMVNGTERADGA